MSKRISLSLLALIVVIAALLFIRSVFAVAPTVTFSGDDTLANGGTDDAYDSLVVIDIVSDYDLTTAWEIEYSVDSGDNWELVTAPYTDLSSTERQYYWSTSAINSTFVMLRTRTRSNADVSPYATESLSLEHRFSILTDKYAVENFTTTDFAGGRVDALWDISQGNASLQPTTFTTNQYDSSLIGSWPLTQATNRTEELIANDIANVGDVRIANGANSVYHFSDFVSNGSSFTGTVNNLDGIGMSFLETDKFLVGSGDTVRITGQTATAGGGLQNLKLALAECPTCPLLSSEYSSTAMGNFQANLLMSNSSASTYARLTANASVGTILTVSNIIVKNITPKVLDTTSYGNHLVVNGPTFTSNHLNVLSTAMSFDGVNDYLQIGDTNNLSLGNNFAFSAWVYLNNNNSFPIFQRSTTTPTHSVELLADSGFELVPSNTEMRANDAGQDWYESRQQSEAAINRLSLDTGNIGGNGTHKAQINNYQQTVNTYLTQGLPAPVTSGNFTAQWNVYIDSIADSVDDRTGYMFLGKDLDGINGPNSNDAERWALFSFSKVGGGSVGGGLSFGYRSTGAGWITATSTLNFDQWYTVKVVGHLANDTFDLYINNQLLVAGYSAKTPVIDPAFITFATFSTDGGNFYIDNVSFVSEVLNPAQNYLSIENNKLTFGKNANPTVLGNMIVASGGWHQVTVSVNGKNSVKFYVDGNPDAEINLTGAEDFGHLGSLMFGRFTTPTAKYANGKMSDLKFFNRSLTDAEAEKLFIDGTLSPENVAYWRLDEDLSNWGGNGSIFANDPDNGLFLTSVGIGHGTAFGKYGNAGEFNGNGEYLAVIEHAPSQFTAGDSFTLSTWFKGADNGSNLIADGGLIDRERYGLIVGDLCPESHLGFYIDIGNDPTFVPETVCSVTTLKPDLWYFASAVYQDNGNGTGSLALYLNGKLEATVSGNDLSSAGALSNLLIARGYTAGDFNGAIDEIKIWSGAKSGTEVAHDYSADVEKTFSETGQITSTNLLENFTTEVYRATLQPVQNLNGGTVEYQVSNDGINWYGDNSGAPTPDTWYSFASDVVPTSATFTFASLGDKLYWRARLTASTDGKSSIIYQVRLNWEGNYPPQACFIANPVRSDAKETPFNFYADCSSDPNGSIYDLDYRWDWESTNNWSDWKSGWGNAFLETHVFNSTSTFAVKLEVKDEFGSTSQFTNYINGTSTESNISGWAWSSNHGWTSLNCDNMYYGTSSSNCDLGYGWRMVDNKLFGWAWNDNIGWLCVGESCTGPIPGEGEENRDPFATYSTESGEIFGWAKYVAFGEGGWLKLRDNTWCGESTNDQCVYFDKVRGALYGWGWAGGQDGSNLTGPGWTQFSGTMNIPWFETKYGTVYSRGDVGSAKTTFAPQNRYNATYCVFAKGSIVNLSSEQGCLNAGYSDLGFPETTSQYRTTLGVVDFENLLDGEEIVNNSETYNLADAMVLKSKVYHFTSPNGLTIDKPIAFHNDRDKGFDYSGAGTIIIEGDLRINKDMNYESAPVTRQIENLASVVWIVKGDVIIAPSVTKLVGLFVVLGKDGVACPNDHCGQFKTGNDTGNPTQLIVSGAIIARKIVFERTYKVSSRPAEQIIYDGRAAVNVPIGLEDIGKGLPLFRETPSAN
jgi:hypothetical protein